MNKNLIYFIGILISISCTSQKESLTVKNTLEIERLEELVVISRAKIESLNSEKKKGIFPIILDKNTIIPSQLEDTDGDGQWDQVLFVTDFKPKEEKKFNIEYVLKRPKYPKTTNIHFGVGLDKKDVLEVRTYKRLGDPRYNSDKRFFQMEGPAWENDKVGFRMYFDPRNGIDIFGKTTSDLVLSQVGIKGNYHAKEDWGMDILKVGNSLGAGAIAIQLKDSLYRITGKNGAIFNVIEEGPVKASFEMEYRNETIQGIPVQVKHRISIYKGQWHYKSEVFLSGITSEMKLVSGIVNLKPNTVHHKTIDNYFNLYSYGKQSEIGDHLGMALLLNKDLYHTHKTIAKNETGITNTHYVAFNAENNTPISFYFLSGWEASNPVFNTQDGFSKEISNISERLSHPILVE